MTTILKQTTVPDNNSINSENQKKLEKLILRINNLLEKGKNVEMRNKLDYELTLTETKSIINKNITFLSSLREDMSYTDVMKRLNRNLEDLESKLSNLALVSFCRSKAEKFLEESRKELSYINLVLMSIVNDRNFNTPLPLPEQKQVITKPEPSKNYDNDIIKLSKEIDNLKNALKEKPKKQVILESKPSIVVEEKDDSKVTINKSEYNFYLGMSSYYGISGPVNYEKALDYLTKAYNENANAKYLIAKMYQNGFYLEKNLKKALSIYKDASDMGHSNSTLELAYLAEEGLICDSDRALLNETELENYYENKNKYCLISYKYYVLAAKEQNSSEANYLLYNIFSEGTHFQSINENTAYEYLKRSLEIDSNPKALNAYGNLLYYGSSIVKKDVKKAVEKYQQASKSGNLDAVNALGVCYESGIGVEKDTKKAFELYNYASQFQHPISMTNKAIYMIINNSNKNVTVFQEAYKLLLNSINLHSKGNKNAYYYLGFIYENGYHTGKTIVPDIISAYRMYKKAFKRGHIHAHTKLGIVLSNGIEGYLLKNEEFAFKLFEIAAEAGDVEAANNLGLIYESGNSYISSNYEKSLYYYNLAYKAGHDDATFNIARLEKHNINNSNNSNNDDLLIKDDGEFKKSNQFSNNNSLNAIVFDKDFRKNKTVYFGTNIVSVNSNANINSNTNTNTNKRKANSGFKSMNNNSISYDVLLKSVSPELGDINNEDLSKSIKYNEMIKLSAMRGSVLASKIQEKIEDENLSVLKSFIERKQTYQNKKDN